MRYVMILVSLFWMAGCSGVPTAQEEALDAFEGKWSITLNKVDRENKIGALFSQASVELDDDQEAIFTFTVHDAWVKQKLKTWRLLYPDLDITRFDVVTKATWNIAQTGEYLYFDKLASELLIEGEGEHFEGFVHLQQAKFQVQEPKQKASGPMSAMMGMMMQEMRAKPEGVKMLDPQLADQFTFRFTADHKLVQLVSRQERPQSELILAR